MKKAFATLAMVAVVFCGTTASAQTPTHSTPDYTEHATTQGDQVVTFGGDQLAGDPNSAYGFTLRRPPGVLRLLLLRPRVNFVNELVKSVENL